MSNCVDCGRELPASAAFCGRCGAPVQPPATGDSFPPTGVASSLPPPHPASSAPAGAQVLEPRPTLQPSAPSNSAKKLGGTETMRRKRMPNTQIEAKGFFASLFDFGFTSFITLKILRVLYGVLVVLILLTGVGFFVALISQGGAYIAIAIIIVPIVTLIDLVWMRVFMEMVALFFRIGENTSIMAASAGSAGPTSEGPHSGLAGPYSGPTGPVSGPLPTPGS